ncbi:MAG TPA: 4-hydroxy-tetrahydrodipicolinate synthase [Candidatus Acidoferrales bacterium]|jgi:4-hydroxy-tetrahydrodipicolinate synthase|nr:4-hydroxy-tetrahydrodipicolinate synthase [Candidatus Acidoferrales bacterium]
MIPMQKTFLCGSYPPLLTPFRGGKVDLEKFAELAERQAREGSHGVVVCGTTGEPSSLTPDERTELVKVAVDVIAKRIPVVAATGSQSFAETVEITTRAEKAGADAVLVVTPYYIKPSQRGLVEYFVSVGQRTELPLMIYHIPGRAAVSVKPATVVRIAERLPNLVGIKHAVNDLEFVTELLTELGPEFRIFCGLEALSLPMLVVGARGLMNAVSNLAPARVAALYEAVERGDLATAQKLHAELFELNQSIFLDTNPGPLKYMMGRLGLLDSPELRLPLVSMDGEQAKILDKVLIRSGLLRAAISRGN